MKIMPLTFNLNRTRFTGNDNDIKKMIFDSLNESLSGAISSGDEFVPSTPTQPIIVERLEIKTGENKNSAAGSIAGGGLGSLGGAGISKIGSKKQANSTQQSPEQSTEQAVDYNKIADDSAKETSQNDSDRTGFDIDEDEDIHDDYGDEDSDFSDDEE